MKIHVRDIIRVSGASEAVDVSGLPDVLHEGYLGYSFDRPLQFKGTITHMGNGTMELEGTLTVHISTTCSRCLRPIERTYTVDVAETFQSDRHTPRYLPYVDVEDDSEADEGIYRFDGSTVDLDDALKDQAILVLPGRELCEDDCPGLCPVCGRRLDDPECTHDADATQMADETDTSPFAGLKDLL